MNRIEKTIAELSTETPPAEWKDELLASAIRSQQPGTRTLTFPKVFIGAMAACWALIFALHFTTPADPGGTDLAERYGVPPEQLPLLAQRFFTYN